MQKRGVFLFLFICLMLVSSFGVVSGQEGEGDGVQGEDSGVDGGEEVDDFDLEFDEDEGSSEVDEEYEGDFESEHEEDEVDLDEIEGDYSDSELEIGGGGIDPDSPFYFVDKWFDGNDLETLREKAAEIRDMIEKGKIDDARKAFREFERRADEVIDEVNPDEREEARRIMAGINRALKQYREDYDFVEDVLNNGENVVTAVEIASKIKDLCVQLKDIDPGEFYRICRAEDDGPKWHRDLFEDLSEEQRKEAELFIEVMGECMRSEGRECECSKIPHEGFSEMCSVVAPLASKCSEGDESACEEMDEQTEDMYDILADAPHLQAVLRELEEFEDERYERYGGPPECEGIRDKMECEEKIFRKKAPRECVDALERGDFRFDGMGEARHACEGIMMREHAPECADEGIDNPRDCARFMERRFGGPGDLEGDRGHGMDCRGINDPKERLKCFDGFSREYEGKSFDERFRETKERERECAERCSNEGGAWDFSGGKCSCHFSEDNNYDEYYDDYDGEHDEDYEDYEDYEGPDNGDFEGSPDGGEFDGQYGEGDYEDYEGSYDGGEYDGGPVQEGPSDGSGEDGGSSGGSDGGSGGGGDGGSSGGSDGGSGGGGDGGSSGGSDGGSGGGGEGGISGQVVRGITGNAFLDYFGN